MSGIPAPDNITKNTGAVLHLLRKRHKKAYEAVKFTALSGLLLFLAVKGVSGIDYRWQWYRIPRILFGAGTGKPGVLLSGLEVTLIISALSLILSTAAGFITAMMRLSGSHAASILSRIYLEAVRNTPLLIQIFVMYFVAAPILGIGRVAAAVLALGLFEGAYASEIIRSGIESVPSAQHDAAYSLGLSPACSYRLIILPQAFRKILPMLASQTISLVKDSSLVSTIAIYDLTMQAQIAVSRSFLSFEVWFSVAAVYLAINLSLSQLVHMLDKRMKRR